MVPHLNKLESPSPNDALCQIWLKLAQRFWRRRSSNFVNVFLLFLNYLPLEEDRALHLNRLESLSPKDALCKVSLKLVLEKKIFKFFVNVFSLFGDYFPLEKGKVLYLNRLESSSPKNALCQVWLEFAQWLWRFLNFIKVFLLFGYSLPLEMGGGALHLNKLESLYPRMLCDKFGWNWPSGSVEAYLNFVYIFSLFRNYLPLEEGRALHLNKI